MSKASKFREKLAQREEQTCEKVFAGLPFKLRRVGLDTLIVAGVLPESFYRELLSVRSGRSEHSAPEDLINSLDADAQYALMLAGPKIVIAAVVEPRIVAGNPGEDEISLFEIPDEAKSEIVQWVMAGCPDLPIRLKGGGEIKRDDLARFRQKQTGGKPFTLEPDGAEIREASQPIAATG